MQKVKFRNFGCISTLTETWKRHMSESKVIGILFADFRKAFDCVDYTILTQKLIAAGITSDDWNLSRKQGAVRSYEWSEICVETDCQWTKIREKGCSQCIWMIYLTFHQQGKCTCNSSRNLRKCWRMRLQVKRSGKGRKNVVGQKPGDTRCRQNRSNDNE